VGKDSDRPIRACTAGSRLQRVAAVLGGGGRGLLWLVPDKANSGGLCRCIHPLCITRRRVLAAPGRAQNNAHVLPACTTCPFHHQLPDWTSSHDMTLGETAKAFRIYRNSVRYTGSTRPGPRFLPYPASIAPVSSEGIPCLPQPTRALFQHRHHRNEAVHSRRPPPFLRPAFLLRRPGKYLYR
jgi:hypothetical protein